MWLISVFSSSESWKTPDVGCWNKSLFLAIVSFSHMCSHQVSFSFFGMQVCFVTCAHLVILGGWRQFWPYIYIYIYKWRWSLAAGVSVKIKHCSLVGLFVLAIYWSTITLISPGVLLLTRCLLDTSRLSFIPTLIIYLWNPGPWLLY